MTSPTDDPELELEAVQGRPGCVAWILSRLAACSGANLHGQVREEPRGADAQSLTWFRHD